MKLLGLLCDHALDNCASKVARLCAKCKSSKVLLVEEIQLFSFTARGEGGERLCLSVRLFPQAAPFADLRSVTKVSPRLPVFSLFFQGKWCQFLW